MSDADPARRIGPWSACRSLLVPIVLLAAALVVTAGLRLPVRRPAYGELRSPADARAHRSDHD
jgi:hypothetical protein